MNSLLRWVGRRCSASHGSNISRRPLVVRQFQGMSVGTGKHGPMFSEITVRPMPWWHNSDDRVRFYTIDVGALCGGHATGYHSKYDEGSDVIRIFTTQIKWESAVSLLVSVMPAYSNERAAEVAALKKELGRE